MVLTTSMVIVFKFLFLFSTQTDSHNPSKPQSLDTFIFQFCIWIINFQEWFSGLII